LLRLAAIRSAGEMNNHEKEKMSRIVLKVVVVSVATDQAISWVLKS
jgi:hypothetical protein